MPKDTILEDSNTKTHPLPIEDIDTKFSSTQLIVPVSFIAVAAFGIENGAVKSLNRDINQKIAGHRVYIDDYLQYAPAVAIFGLSFVGATPTHNYTERAIISATAYISVTALAQGAKYLIHSPRPNKPSETNSWPSGHTATAFTGAEIIRREYWNDSPVYGIAAYAVATSVGVLRVYNNRHWPTDVLAGAGFGILSAQIGYWLLPINKRLCRLVERQIAFAPYFTEQASGLSLAYSF
ncbi:phospholipid phosphatase [Bacteroidia bacterium]|nr:phospholipid phosphatase [Bacteroidia bacterium]